MEDSLTTGSDVANLAHELALFLGEGVKEVEHTHRLLVPDLKQEPIIEVYLEQFKSRVLALTKDSDAARTHAFLLESKLPVFSSFHTEKLNLLLVPDGTKRISAILPAINRDPIAYRKIFYDLGRLIRDLETLNIGLPELALLDSIAFAHQEEGQGGRLYLIPPYKLKEPNSRSEELEQVRFEMELSETMTPETIDFLIEAIRDGWDAIG